MHLHTGQQTTITIYARQKWNNTAIEVQPGETYIFEATGTWSDMGKKSGPEGYTNAYMRLFNRFKRFKQADWFALIGSINKQTDFLIDCKNPITFTDAGTLFCYANDANGFYWNNCKSIRVTVTRKS